MLRHGVGGVAENSFAITRARTELVGYRRRRAAETMPAAVILGRICVVNTAAAAGACAGSIINFTTAAYMDRVYHFRRRQWTKSPRAVSETLRQMRLDGRCDS